jgi:hypothetical protein
MTRQEICKHLRTDAGFMRRLDLFQDYYTGKQRLFNWRSWKKFAIGWLVPHDVKQDDQHLMVDIVLGYCERKYGIRDMAGKKVE